MEEHQLRQIKILISSTRADLTQYREEGSKLIGKVAAERARRIQLVDVSMEKETQSGNREFAVAISKRWVEEADWVIVIVGWNYGTISDEPDGGGLSVTEWEYRHASKLGKKLFVFMAGERNTENEYRCSAEEKEDLKNWRKSEPIEKLQRFREELGRTFVGMFCNLQHFREQLERTLEIAIDDLFFEIQPGTPLAELIMAVMPSIHDCIRKVNVIAKCKKIHDRLHDLRQHVIRPLTEQVLPVWKQEGTLSASRERVIWKCMTKCSGAVEGIRSMRASIGPDHQGLCCSVDKVLERSSLWNMELDLPETRPDRGVFAEIVDNFASHVQDAFNEADRSMEREKSDLRERYQYLLQELKHAREKRNLGPSDQKRLDDELENVDTNRLRVKDCLACHHSWHEGHDALEKVECFRETNRFQRELNLYCGTPLEKLLSLIDHELEQAGARDLEGGPPIKGVIGAGARRQDPSQTSTNQHIRDAFVDDLSYLKKLLEALRRGADADLFDKVRRPFDDAFYFVDKRTLREVEQAEERVVKLEDWLDGLAAREKKCSGTPPR